MAFGASAAARWQATQTRARMGASLWWLLIKCAAFAWLTCTVFVVWRETGQAFPGLRHAYFWRWMVGGIFMGVPLLIAWLLTSCCR